MKRFSPAETLPVPGMIHKGAFRLIHGMHPGRETDTAAALSDSSKAACLKLTPWLRFAPPDYSWCHASGVGCQKSKMVLGITRFSQGEYQAEYAVF